MLILKRRRYFSAAVHAKASAVAPTVTYVNSYGISSGNGTTTAVYNGVDIGNPSYIATRRVIIAISGLASLAVPVSGTINGVSIDQLTTLSNGSSGSQGIDFVSAPVPSGTTGVTVSITFAFSIGVPRIMDYHTDGSLLSSITPATGYTSNTGGTGTNTTTVNTTTKAGGFMLACAWVGGGAGPSITASTETFGAADYSVSANFADHVDGITSNASNSVSTQGPPAGGNSGLGLAAWL